MVELVINLRIKVTQSSQGQKQRHSDILYTDESRFTIMEKTTNGSF